MLRRVRRHHSTKPPLPHLNTRTSAPWHSPRATGSPVRSPCSTCGPCKRQQSKGALCVEGTKTHVSPSAIGQVKLSQKFNNARLSTCFLVSFYLYSFIYPLSPSFSYLPFPSSLPLIPLCFSPPHSFPPLFFFLFFFLLDFFFPSPLSSATRKISQEVKEKKNQMPRNSFSASVPFSFLFFSFCCRSLPSTRHARWIL